MPLRGHLLAARDMIPQGGHEIRSLPFLVSTIIQKVWSSQSLLRVIHGMKIFRTDNSKDCRHVEIVEKVAWNSKYRDDVQKEESFSQSVFIGVDFDFSQRNKPSNPTSNPCQNENN